jgi:ammonium transporter, Amt family
MANLTTAELAVALDTLWVLVAGCLVFLMHLGFATVEAGFTQAKNTVNILMKNFLTVSIGVLGFYLVGFALMFGPDLAGLVGSSGFALSGAVPEPPLPLPAFWFFQAMFAATAATIVSGAVAERTRFLAYCLFAMVLTAVIYPVVGHWVWGGGWLAALGFVDFAGSTVVHGVGGWAALVGAAVVGPRIGKYVGGVAQVIPAHSIPLGAVGTLLLWFGWFGFNAGSTLSGTSTQIADIAVTTLLAAAAATVTGTIVSLVRSGKADPIAAMNGALGGLVAITAGTAAVSPPGAIAIGAVAGLVLVFALEFVERVLKVDDPVGAVSVHLVCGALGTLLVGLFALEGGLFYGGGLALLAIQATGVLAVGLFTFVSAWATWKLIDLLIGVRVSEAEEIAGLDFYEHGLTAYDDVHAKRARAARQTAAAD